ncbi:IucA/IucC family protein [Streptomyces sp. CB01881]|uniref:IucA/IucC family protein n=1 Tax=Streptomyces sp. CB01881 TaxID=2078691 RepID=UPI000CDC5F7B|nr:IucA/IucC family protein [Streptomyces sp. CB01881]AUY48966.1 iron transporter [Streptomyces sp. CB01881]TYC77454.1 iron transporter [Streptomyces sp. CB01881]
MTHELPTADHAVAHTLLNCLLREVSAPEHQTAVADGRLLLRLPRRGVLLRIALRRTSLLGAHRFTGPAEEERPGGWSEVDWHVLAGYVRDELELRTGSVNEEFLEQLTSSHDVVRSGMEDRPAPGTDRYLESEQALLLGHRFHPAPKSRSAERGDWRSYAPESRAAFRLHHLAVREELVAESSADPAATALLDGLREAPAGYRLLPAHPWQYQLVAGHPLLRGALESGDVLDLGPGGEPFTATASVRTLYGTGAFLKFSLNVRITNCLRKNAAYELTGAVALTRLLGPVLADLAERFPGAAMLREPAFRTLSLPGADGRPDRSLYEGFGLIVREGFADALHPGVTPLLAAAVADEHPTSSAHVSALLGPEAGVQEALAWWTAYLRLLVPPVLAAYFDHGVVLEPHLQNVLIGVDAAGRPAQVLFRDLEGTKLVPDRNAALLAALPPEVAGPMAYDAERGWDRVVYCLLVNHVAELLAALADRHPEAEGALWEAVRRVLEEYAAAHGRPPRLRALLAGVPLPAKANLLTRWERRPDREAGYVRLPSPLARTVLAEAAHLPPQGARTPARSAR